MGWNSNCTQRRITNLSTSMSSTATFAARSGRFLRRRRERIGTGRTCPVSSILLPRFEHVILFEKDNRQMNPILSASITNCHVTGLDSIVFKQDAPMVRVYFAHKDHILWKNKPYAGIMSLGFH